MSSRQVVVIGGGVAGCGSALRLADDGWRVTLLERDRLLDGTSNSTPGRLHLGFHFTDLHTCIHLLRSAIRVAKTFPGFFIGEELGLFHPLRRGRYMIRKDSLFSAQETECLYEKIKSEYTKLVDEDPSNAVFGKPEHFYRKLKPEEYKEHVDLDRIETAFETAEHFLDWQKFKKYLSQKVKDHVNITVCEGSEVVDVHAQGNPKRYSLVVKNGDKMNTVHSDYTVNSAWYEIDKLNALAGFNVTPCSKTNRLKALLRVRLPEELKHVHSMLFGMGPFGMFSNTGDGCGFIIYEPLTFAPIPSDVEMLSKMQRLLTDGPTEAEFKYYTEAIKEGMSQYIPALKRAEVEGLLFGIVQTHGGADLFLRDSDYHRRAYFGVREEGAGWVSNPGMKLTYFLDNAEIVHDLLTRRFTQDQVECQGPHH